MIQATTAAVCSTLLVAVSAFAAEPDIDVLIHESRADRALKVERLGQEIVEVRKNRDITTADKKERIAQLQRELRQLNDPLGLTT